MGLLCAPFVIATPEYTKKENKRCLYCHPAFGKPDLNDAGEYYKKHKTLKGYEGKEPSTSLLHRQTNGREPQVRMFRSWVPTAEHSPAD